MAVYGITGTLYFGSITTTAGGGGTAIDNVEARTFDININRRAVSMKTGRADDQRATYYLGTSLVCLVLRGRDVSSATINLMFQDLATGGAVRPDVTKVGAAAATTGLMIVPSVSTERIFYMPNATLLTAEQAIKYSPSQSFLEDNEVAFVPQREADNTEPGWMYAVAATINAAYTGITS